MTSQGAKFRATLARRLDAYRSKAPAAIAAGARIVAAEIARRAPRLTGELAASVEDTPARATGRGASARVEVAADHVASVEFGDRDEPPRPFIRPGLDASRRSARDAIARRLK